MANEIQDLLKLGLTNGEAKVYLALTELGSSKVGPIVKNSGVAYSNLYDILRRLIDKGIVSYITKNKTKYFQAVSPANLIDYLEKKEKEIVKQKESLKQIVPKLEKLQETAPKQDAEIFVGKKGLKAAYLKMLSDEKDEHLFLYTNEEEFAEESDLFYLGIRKELGKRKLRGITNKAYAKSIYAKQSKHLQLKFLDFPLPGNIDICNDKILHISWKKPTIAILIHSEDIANNMKKYFHQLWKTATS